MFKFIRKQFKLHKESVLCSENRIIQSSSDRFYLNGSFEKEWQNEELVDLLVRRKISRLERMTKMD
jgi:hypothetical protein